MPANSQPTPHNPGKPTADTILKEVSFIPDEGVTDLQEAAPTHPKKAYQIIITNQTDEYEAPLSEEELPTFGLERVDSQSDQFAGTDRKAAKISVASAPVEVFTDLKDLLISLTSEADMINHHPKITKDANSGRVQEENRNVRVNAFLYAASREADNDYHLIIGRAKTAKPFQCMNVEVSGLPPANSPFFNQLNTARKSFKDFFGNKVPGPSYNFYPKPIPVVIEGSLFFDITHATGGRPGPQDLKQFIPSIWEIHPITSIRFEP